MKQSLLLYLFIIAVLMNVFTYKYYSMKELSNEKPLIDNAKKLTEQKRYYISDYGYKNMVDYVNCKTDMLIPGENYEKHNLVNLIAWWKNKASNRFDTLKNENRLRTELEVWTSGKPIDIIR